MDEHLRQRMGELFEQGGGESVGPDRFLPLVELDSGARLGLDAQASWTADVGDGRLRPFAGPEQGRFIEGLETPRDQFDQRLAEAADAAGLPAAEVVASFPVVELVGAVLAAAPAYYCRLALLWLLPSELRPLRDAIVEVSRTGRVPQLTRELAQRLVVPE